MKKRTTIPATAVIWVACVRTAFAAYDIKYQSGASCLLDDPDDVLRGNGYIYNFGNAPSAVVCPVQRDDGGDATPEIVDIDIYNNSGGGSFACEFRTSDSNSTNSYVKTVSTSSSGYARLSVPTPTQDFGTTASYYTLVCALPAKVGSSTSKLFGYRWEE